MHRCGTHATRNCARPAGCHSRASKRQKTAQIFQERQSLREKKLVISKMRRGHGLGEVRPACQCNDWGSRGERERAVRLKFQIGPFFPLHFYGGFRRRCRPPQRSQAVDPGEMSRFGIRRGERSASVQICSAGRRCLLCSTNLHASISPMDVLSTAPLGHGWPKKVNEPSKYQYSTGRGTRSRETDSE